MKVYIGYNKVSKVEKTLSIRPLLRGTKIVSLKVEDVQLPLKKSLSLEDLPKLVEAAEVFFEYIDIKMLGESIFEQQEEKLPEWENEALRNFVITSLRDSQAVLLGVLVEYEEVTREEFIDEMKKRLKDAKYRGWDLGGQLAGITMKSKSAGYERPFKKEWRIVGNEWKCFYCLSKKKYADIIRNALKERK